MIFIFKNGKIRTCFSKSKLDEYSWYLSNCQDEKKSCKYSYWKYLYRILEFSHNWNWVSQWRKMEYIVFDKHLLRMNWNNILIYARMVLFFVFLQLFFLEKFPIRFLSLVLLILIKLICYEKKCNFYIKSSCINSTRAESILLVQKKRRRQTE